MKRWTAAGGSALALWSSVGQAQADDLAAELEKYPKEWIERKAARHGLDITLDGKVWINTDRYGDTDDYAVAASDIARSTGLRNRKGWVRGYHLRNAKVAYRESKRQIAVDCAERTWATTIAVFYDAQGRVVRQDGPSFSTPAVPGSYADGWLEMLCSD